MSRVTRYKFLGIMVVEALSFDVHIKNVCTKVLQPKCVIRRVSNMVPDNVLHSLQFALIYIRITSVICAGGSAYTTAFKRLKSSKKKTITMKSFIPSFPGRSFLQFEEAYRYFVLCKMFEVVGDGTHLPFANKMDQHTVLHNYETRSNVGS